MDLDILKMYGITVKSSTDGYCIVTLHGAKPRGFCLVIQTFFFLLH
jgi:hypothetical protein